MVDVAHAPELAKQFQVRSTPSAVAVVQGKVVDKYVCGTRESANRDALLTGPRQVLAQGRAQGCDLDPQDRVREPVVVVVVWFEC